MLSLVLSTQRRSTPTSGGGQLGTHPPEAQKLPFAQALPQAPQLSGLVTVSTQLCPQAVRPWVQVHSPAMQVWLAVQLGEQTATDEHPEVSKDKQSPAQASVPPPMKPRDRQLWPFKFAPSQTSLPVIAALPHTGATQVPVAQAPLAQSAPL